MGKARRHASTPAVLLHQRTATTPDNDDEPKTAIKSNKLLVSPAPSMKQQSMKQQLQGTKQKIVLETVAEDEAAQDERAHEDDRKPPASDPAPAPMIKIDPVSTSLSPEHIVAFHFVHPNLDYADWLTIHLPLDSLIDPAHPDAFIAGWRAKLAEHITEGFKHYYDSLLIPDSHFAEMKQLLSTPEQIHQNLFLVLFDRVLTETDHTRLHRSATSTPGLIRDLLACKAAGSSPSIVYYFSGELLSLFQRTVLSTQGHPPIAEPFSASYSIQQRRERGYPERLLGWIALEDSIFGIVDQQSAHLQRSALPADAAAPFQTPPSFQLTPADRAPNPDSDLPPFSSPEYRNYQEQLKLLSQQHPDQATTPYGYQGTPSTAFGSVLFDPLSNEFTSPSNKPSNEVTPPFSHSPAVDTTPPFQAGYFSGESTPHNSNLKSFSRDRVSDADKIPNWNSPSGAPRPAASAPAQNHLADSAHAPNHPAHAPAEILRQRAPYILPPSIARRNNPAQAHARYQTWPYANPENLQIDHFSPHFFQNHPNATTSSFSNQNDGPAPFPNHHGQVIPPSHRGSSSLHHGGHPSLASTSTPFGGPPPAPASTFTPFGGPPPAQASTFTPFGGVPPLAPAHPQDLRRMPYQHQGMDGFSLSAAPAPFSMASQAPASSVSGIHPTMYVPHPSIAPFPHPHSFPHGATPAWNASARSGFHYPPSHHAYQQLNHSLNYSPAGPSHGAPPPFGFIAPSHSGHPLVPHPSLPAGLPLGSAGGSFPGASTPGHFPFGGGPPPSGGPSPGGPPFGGPPSGGGSPSPYGGPPPSGPPSAGPPSGGPSGGHPSGGPPPGPPLPPCWSSPPPSNGVMMDNAEWYEYRLKNPTAVNINSSTGTILPWQAYRPRYGLVVNHAVPLTLHELDKTRFMSHFHSTVFDPKHLRIFQDGFPKLPSGSTRKALLGYYSKIVQYCCLYGIYVPPLHTLVSGNIMGLWFFELPALTQSSVSTTFPSLLLNCLLNSKTNIVNNDDFGVLLRHIQNGYALMYNLAVVGGHPTLLDHPSTPRIPHQFDTDTLADYMVNWQHYLYLRILSGVYLSDRYFLVQFIQGLHRSFLLVRQYLDSVMAPYNGPHTIHEPIPAALTPERLLLSLDEYATSIHKPRLCTRSARAALALGSSGYLPGHRDGRDTRDKSSTQLALRELSGSLPAPDSDPDPLSTDEMDTLFVHAVTQRPSGCFFCQADSHAVRECPKFASLQKNPFGLRLLRRVLDHALRPASDTPTSAIRQLESSLDSGEGSPPSADSPSDSEADFR
jgi:hypothetical protein